MSKRVHNKKGRSRKRVPHPTKIRGGTHMSRTTYIHWYRAVTRVRREQDAAARRGRYRY